MTILAIDASGVTASAAIVTESKTIAEFSISCGLTHSQTLMPMVDEMFKTTGLSPRDVDFIACTSGPGSFTGLRIGAACAKGLAAGLSKKIIPVPTLDALAYNIFGTDACIAPIMDARRGQVYSAFYRYGGGVFERVSEYEAEDVRRVAEKAAVFGRPVVFLGDGVYPNLEILIGCKNFILAPPSLNLQRAASAGALALRLVEEGKAVTPEDFRLIYMRKPQAEREYEERNGL